MNKELNELMARLEQTESRLAASEARMNRVTRRARIAGGLGLIALVASTLILSRPAAMAQSAGVTLASLLARVVALETKTAAINQTGTPGTTSAKLTITGDNVQIVDGSGYTDDGTAGETSNTTLSGLGNLIIGYDLGGNDQGHGDVHTGSHNLIMGDLNNYSSYGGVVVGFDNAVTNGYGTVTGGRGNLASGFLATVNGGEFNTASGGYSSIIGGSGNKASNFYASAIGGADNIANGEYSFVSGGQGNTANNDESSVSGGQANIASGAYSSVSGGFFNTAYGDRSSVSGGQYNSASGNYSSVSGGNTVIQSNYSGWSGGDYHSP